MPSPLEPPPEGLYSSKDELVTQCKEHAKQAGYALSILRNDAANKSLVLACVCYGKPLNRWKLTEETRQRPNRSSKKTDCKMNCFCKQKDDGWMLEVRVGEHNHVAAPIGTYSAHRPRDATIKERIEQDMWAGCMVRQTQAQLQQQFPGTLLTKRDIFNERAQAKVKALGGQSMVEALLQELKDGGYYYAYEVYPETHDKSGMISHLLIIHPESLAIYKSNFDVLILDCTYKTNRYNYPLLDLVGSTGMNTSFNLGICLLHKEVSS
jgi:MULE transposase-like protein